MATTKMSLGTKLAEIQTKFKSKKSRYNNFGKYYFRSAEDILEAIKPFLLELNVTVTVSEELINNESFPIIKSTATIVDAADGSTHTATAIVGVDLDQKGMQMPQKFGSASSYGKKYALGNLFLIDDTQDSDASNDHGKKAAPAKPKITVGSEAFDKAKAYVTDEDKLNVILTKYDVDPAAVKALKSML